ncbi:MAG: hypothetical protein V3T21_04925 [Candidatus Margulisiibacteriota bacterium]
MFIGTKLPQKADVHIRTGGYTEWSKFSNKGSFMVGGIGPKRGKRNYRVFLDTNLKNTEFERIELWFKKGIRIRDLESIVGKDIINLSEIMENVTAVAISRDLDFNSVKKKGLVFKVDVLALNAKKVLDQIAENEKKKSQEIKHGRETILQIDIGPEDKPTIWVTSQHTYGSSAKKLYSFALDNLLPITKEDFSRLLYLRRADSPFQKMLKANFKKEDINEILDMIGIHAVEFAVAMLMWEMDQLSEERLKKMVVAIQGTAKKDTLSLGKAMQKEGQLSEQKLRGIVEAKQAITEEDKVSLRGTLTLELNNAANEYRAKHPGATTYLDEFEQELKSNISSVCAELYTKLFRLVVDPRDSKEIRGKKMEAAAILALAILSEQFTEKEVLGFLRGEPNDHIVDFIANTKNDCESDKGYRIFSLRKAIGIIIKS